MSTRLSLLLLAGAFALLCGIVLLTLPPARSLPPQFDAVRQDREQTGPLPILPVDRRGCGDPVRIACREQPSIRPAATRR